MPMQAVSAAAFMRKGDAGARVTTVGGHIDVRSALLVKCKSGEAAGPFFLEKVVQETVDLEFSVVAPHLGRGSAVRIKLDKIVLVDVPSRPFSQHVIYRAVVGVEPAYSVCMHCEIGVVLVMASRLQSSILSFGEFSSECR